MQEDQQPWAACAAPAKAEAHSVVAEGHSRSPAVAAHVGRPLVLRGAGLRGSPKEGRGRSRSPEEGQRSPERGPEAAALPEAMPVPALGPGGRGRSPLALGRSPVALRTHSRGEGHGRGRSRSPAAPRPAAARKKSSPGAVARHSPRPPEEDLPPPTLACQAMLTQVNLPAARWPLQGAAQRGYGCGCGCG